MTTKSTKAFGQRPRRLGNPNVELEEHRTGRYLYCRRLADRVIEKAPEKHVTEYAQYSQAELLAGVFAWLKAEHYGTPAELRWVIREAGRSLNWPLPDIVLEA